MLGIAVPPGHQLQLVRIVRFTGEGRDIDLSKLNEVIATATGSGTACQVALDLSAGVAVAVVSATEDPQKAPADITVEKGEIDDYPMMIL